MTLTQFVAGTRDQLAGAWPVTRSFVSTRHGGVPGATLQAALSGCGWRSERVLPTVSDTAVVMVSGPDGQAGVLKVAASERGMASLSQEWDVLGRLWSEERLRAWRGLLPMPLTAGDMDGGSFLLVSRLTGRDGRQVRPAAAGRLTSAAFGAIAPLHRLGQTMRVPGTALLDQWVNEPADRVRAAVGGQRVIGWLAAALRAELTAGPLPLGWTHGDFYPGNVLVGDRGQVTGIIDWSQARPADLVPLDLAFWLLAAPAAGRPREFGGRVAARLASGQSWTPDEICLLQAVMTGQPLTGRALLMLAWLRHVAANLAKSARYASSPVWSRRNVLPVLRRLDDMAWAGEGL
ncbi:MAG TPA: aminoglycoside phosphotransferase family protein [Streptosporangiaceae bacterium]